MKREIFDTLPYVARKELIDLRNYMRVAFEANSHLIHEAPAEDVLYQFRDSTEKFAFVVRFGSFDDSKKHNVYSVYISPASQTRIKGESNPRTFEQIKESFSRWIDLIQSMHQVMEEYYDPYKRFYDEEFSDFFTNDDEDAANNPFELEKQEVLYYFLSYAEKTISHSSDITIQNKDLLLEEVSALKEKIPTLTKKRLVAALSKFAQRAKTTSNKVFHEIFDVLKKEAIKKLLYEGVDQIPHVTYQVKQWINLF